MFFSIYLIIIFILVIALIFLTYYISQIKERSQLSQRAKTDFVYFAAHQLKAPLSTMKLSLEMLLDGSFGAMTKEQQNIIEKTYQRDKMLIYMVEDLLNVAKIDGGKYFYDITLVDFDALVEFIISNNHEEIEKKKIRFTFEKPTTALPKVMIDKEKICLVIQNLLDNALRYTPAGGEITISFSSDKKALEFKIKDSGIGVPENQKEKLFTKFFRASNALRAEGTGFGLGLFIAKNIIDEHKGNIWFESKENEGSTFFFTLPIQHNGPPC